MMKVNLTMNVIEGCGRNCPNGGKESPKCTPPKKKTPSRKK